MIPGPDPEDAMPARAGGGSVRRRLAWAVVVTMTTVTLLIATVRPLIAHTTSLQTTPTGDGLLSRGLDAIEPRFDEPVEVLDRAIRVLGPTSDRIHPGRAEVESATTTQRISPDPDQTSQVEDPDDQRVGAGGLVAGGVLVLVVVGCVVGFARSARRARDAR